MEQKELNHEYIKYIRSFVDNLRSLEKYSMTLLNDPRLTYLYKRDNDIDVFILEEVIVYCIEKNKDEPNSDRLQKTEDLIKKNKLADYIYKNLDEDNDLFYSKDEYVKRLIQKANLENEEVDREKKQFMHTSVLNITSSYEILINNLYRFYLKHIHKDNSDYADKKISFKDLSSLKDKDEMENYIINKHLEDKFYASVRAWTDDFTKDCTRINKKNFDKDFNKDMDLVVETFERRNLIAHNNGEINYTYLKKVEEYLTSDNKMGESIVTNIEYLKDRVDIFLKLGIYLIINNLKKGYLKNEKFLITELNVIGLELLKNEKIEISRFIFENLIAINTEENPVIQYNYWLTYKLNNEIELVIEEIENYVKENNGKFDIQDRLAISLLTESKDKSIDLSIDFFNSFDQYFDDEKEIQYHKINALVTWPIFEIIKNEKRFIDLKEKVFYTELELKEADGMKPLVSSGEKEVKDTIKKEK